MENCPPSPNSNANPKPNPDPRRRAIFLGGNFHYTLKKHEIFSGAATHLVKNKKYLSEAAVQILFSDAVTHFS